MCDYETSLLLSIVYLFYVKELNMHIYNKKQKEGIKAKCLNLVHRRNGVIQSSESVSLNAEIIFFFEIYLKK